MLSPSTHSTDNSPRGFQRINNHREVHHPLKRMLSPTLPSSLERTKSPLAMVHRQNPFQRSRSDADTKPRFRPKKEEENPPNPPLSSPPSHGREIKKLKSELESEQKKVEELKEQIKMQAEKHSIFVQKATEAAASAAAQAASNPSTKSRPRHKHRRSVSVWCSFGFVV